MTLVMATLRTIDVRQNLGSTKTMKSADHALEVRESGTSDLTIGSWFETTA